MADRRLNRNTDKEQGTEYGVGNPLLTKRRDLGTTRGSQRGREWTVDSGLWTVRVGDSGGQVRMDERGKGVRKGIAAAACLL